MFFGLIGLGHVLHCFCKNDKTSFEGVNMKSLRGILALIACPWIAVAAELHPIVEVQTGYLFGASGDGKWIKADEASKSLTDGATYRVY